MSDEMADIIGEITDYASLHGAFRARAEQLNVSRSNLNEIAGLASGYCEKLLAAKPMKIIGKESLGLLLAALGMKLIAVPDPVTLERFAGRRNVRATHMVRSDGRHWVITANFLRQIGIKGNDHYKRTSKRKRTAAARKAAKARWRKGSSTSIQDEAVSRLRSQNALHKGHADLRSLPRSESRRAPGARAQQIAVEAAEAALS